VNVREISTKVLKSLWKTAPEGGQSTRGKEFFPVCTRMQQERRGREKKTMATEMP
jgi:hypothetical protein